MTPNNYLISTSIFVLSLLAQSDHEGGDSPLEDQGVQSLLEWLVGVLELLSSNPVVLMKSLHSIFDHFHHSHELLDCVSHCSHSELLHSSFVELGCNIFGVVLEGSFLINFDFIGVMSFLRFGNTLVFLH